MEPQESYCSIPMHVADGVFTRFFSQKSLNTNATIDMADSGDSACQTSCSFTGKEKDPETGYSYFGARYLEHELMTGWLSVDPMADKYPSISPYAYCAWNPVKLVDLEGMDIWELDVSGNIVAHRESSESDAFYIVDETGKKIEGAGLTLPYGTVFSFESVADEALECIIDSYELTGDENGTRLFEFLADNTNIEWSHFQLEEKGEKPE